MIAVALGSITALLVGSALNWNSDPSSDGFRTYFYICAGVFFAAALVSLVMYVPPQTEKQRRYHGDIMAKLVGLDWVGYFLIAAGIVLFSVGLTWSQNPYPWSDPHVSATLALGVFFIICLAVYETWFKKDGMFHHGLFQNRNFAIGNVLIFAEGMSFIAANTYFPFENELLFKHDGILVGAKYSTTFITSCFASLLTGLYTSRTRDARWITVLAYVIFTTFFGAMASADRHSGTLLWGLPVLLGTALGISLNTVVTMAQISTPPELIAIATGLLLSIRSLGGTVGVVIFQAILSHYLSQIPANVARAAVSAGLSRGSVEGFVVALTSENQTALEVVPGISSDIIEAGSAALLDSYVSGFCYIWVASGAFVALQVSWHCS